MHLNPTLLVFFLLLTVLPASATEDVISIQGNITSCTVQQPTSSSISIGNYFGGMLDSSRWPARWTCGDWNETEGWVYIISDITIFLSYFSIPIMLLWYIREKSLGNLRWIILLFVAFIGLCGITHLIDATLFWEPVYRLSGFAKLLTGLVSMATAVVLGFVIPSALRFKSPKEMQTEINERRKLQEIFEIFVKYSPGATAMLDSDLEFMMVNDNWYRDYKLQGADITGLSFSAVFPDVDTDDKWTNALTEALKGQVAESEKAKLRYNGETIYLKWRTQPWHLSNGEVGGVFLFTEIITENVLLEKELIRKNKQAQKQAQTMLSVSKVAQIGTWEFDLDTSEIVWSDVVYDIHELPQGGKVELHDVINYYHPDFREELNVAIENAISHQKPYDLELTLVTAKQNIIWVRAIGQPVVKNGKVVALRGLFQDIDSKKKAELILANMNTLLEKKVIQRTSELENVNRELEAFTYTVSHDLRAPLRAINSFSEAFIEEYQDVIPENGIRYLSRITRNSVKMGQLIDDLLEYSRVTRITGDYKTINMREIVSELVENTFSDSLPHITVKSLPSIRGNESLIRQLFQNIISNACKYSRDVAEPRIVIKGTAGENEVIFSISDNGTGFDEKYSDKLYGMFERLHTDDQFEGTGVGLALCKKIMDRHQGRIWAESEIGKGATFYLAFPVKTGI
ncbi:ATP-binding protein [Marinoscillum sp.]|uniref:ATP-binding protein n=1 Tax=Marinoscillum sp. TaxID=2024838 RepID=UPI003BAC8C71